MMSRSYSIAERIVWLLAVAFCAFFWNWNSPLLDAASAREAGAARALMVGTPDSAGPQIERSLSFHEGWAAAVFKSFGTSENSARAIGGIPSLLAFFALVAWTWARMGWLAAWILSLLLFLNPWNTFFRSAAPEALLSCMLVFASIAAHECFWSPRLGFRRRVVWNLLLWGGVVGAVALFGLSGLSLWFGMMISLFLAFLLSPRSFGKLVVGSLLALPLFWLSLAPLGWAAFHMASSREWPTLATGFFQNFLRSHPDWAAGEVHKLEWSPSETFYLFWNETRFWIWPLPLLWVLLLFKRRESPVPRALASSWSLNACAFVVAAIAFASFMSARDARLYLLAFLPPLFPLIGLLVSYLRRENLVAMPRLRWFVFLCAVLAAHLFSRKTTPSQAVARDFVLAAPKINALASDCELLVAPESVDAGDLADFSSWYFNRRKTSFSTHELPSKIAVPAGKVYWDPVDGILWGQRNCQI